MERGSLGTHCSKLVFIPIPAPTLTCMVLFPSLPGSLHQNTNIVNVKVERVTFLTLVTSRVEKGSKDVNVKTLRIAHGYTLGFRTAKRAIVLGNLLTYLASGGQQPYTKQLNV